MTFSTPIVTWLACTGAHSEIAAPAPSGEAEQAALQQAFDAWKSNPSPENRTAVHTAAETALLVEHPSDDLDLLLADVLANVLLRPDLALPRYERHLGRVEGPRIDGWLDTLVRANELRRFDEEHLRLLSEPADVALHVTASAIAAQAANDPGVHWRDVVRGVRAAELVEDALANTRLTFDRPIDALAPTFEVLGLLLQGWDIEIATAKTTVPDDPDMMLVSGVVPVANDKKRLVSYARSADPATLRAAAELIDVQRPPRVVSIAIRIHAPGGGTILLASEANFRHEQLWLFSTNDKVRLTIVQDAADELVRARNEGTPEVDIVVALRDRWLESFLRPVRPEDPKRAPDQPR